MSSTADPQYVSAVPNRPCGVAQHTNCATVKNLDDVPATGKRLRDCEGRPSRALIQAEAQGIRWTDDEDHAPSDTFGMIIPANTTLEYDGDLAMFRFIQDTAGAILNVSFYNF